MIRAIQAIKVPKLGSCSFSSPASFSFCQGRLTILPFRELYAVPQVRQTKLNCVGIVIESRYLVGIRKKQVLTNHMTGSVEGRDTVGCITPPATPTKGERKAKRKSKNNGSVKGNSL